MRTLQDLQAERDGLLGALYSGALTVKDGAGQEITYRSVAELKSALQHCEHRIREIANSGPVNQVRLRTSKGV